MNDIRISERVQVVVIGGGQAGLSVATAWHGAGSPL
jgi:cation diffusion facilitator CzcD-associated flavoprotein CzcO